jgi:hypothetical protein
MTSLAAIVLASTLATAPAGTDEPAPDQPLARPAPKKQEKKLRSSMGGIFLEFGAAMAYLMAGTALIDRDLHMPSAGCDASDNTCELATPVALFFTTGAAAMGWVGASRYARANDANMYYSPIFWAGTARLAGSLVVAYVGSNNHGKDAQLAWDTAYLGTSILGTVLQLVGALTAPPREADPLDYSFRLVPACGPTGTGGLVCGVSAGL